MRYAYQSRGRFFAQVAGGLEEEGAAELEQLGARNSTPVYRGVFFSASSADLRRICYLARLISRVHAPLITFRCRGVDTLYDRAREVRFDDFMDASDRFSIAANVSGEVITHSRYAALRLKDAIVDQFRDRSGTRPTVDREHPEVQFHIYVAGDRATISLDATGGSLHRRGYRVRAGEAPMQETLAGAIVRFTGWVGERPWVDPFCGAGTLLAEALMHVARIPAGFLRGRAGFERLPDFDPGAWRHERAEFDAAIRPIPSELLSGSDRDAQAVTMAQENLRRLPGGDKVSFRVCDFQDLGPMRDRVIVCNPPHGVRLGTRSEVEALYVSLGDYLKRSCAGSTAYLYLGDPSLVRAVGLRPSAKKKMPSGALDGRCCRFELFSGHLRDQRRGPGIQGGPEDPEGTVTAADESLGP